MACAPAFCLGRRRARPQGVHLLHAQDHVRHARGAEAAVRMGGRVNHRFGLDDVVLIKDNHVAASGGILQAIEAARANVGYLVKIEVEVDTLAQLEEALAVGVDAVPLDNMDPDTLREAVAMIAAAGVDLICVVGWLTHSATVLDIGLEWRR